MDYRRRRNVHVLVGEAMRLTVRAPKFAMIGTICMVNGKQLKPGLSPAVERQGRVTLVRFATVRSRPQICDLVRNPSISTYCLLILSGAEKVTLMSDKASKGI